MRDEPAPGVPPGDARDASRWRPTGCRRTAGCARSSPQLVQLRPVLEDPARELWLELPSGVVEIVRAPAPEPDPERPVLFDDEVAVTKRHSRPRDGPPQRAPAVRRVCRERRASAGSWCARAARLMSRRSPSHEGAPGTRSLYGEVRCDALEDLQRDALERPRPQVVVKVDRSGLNDNHPVGQGALRRDRRASCARSSRPRSAARGRTLCARAGALRARDQVGLRALNDALKGAFDTPGKAGFERRRQPPTARAARARRSPRP